MKEREIKELINLLNKWELDCTNHRCINCEYGVIRTYPNTSDYVICPFYLVKDMISNNYHG